MILRPSLILRCTFKRTSRLSVSDLRICSLNYSRLSSIFLTPRTLESMARPIPRFRSWVDFSCDFPKLHIKVFLILSSISFSVMRWTRWCLLEWLLEYAFVFCNLSSYDCLITLSIDWVIWLNFWASIFYNMRLEFVVLVFGGTAIFFSLTVFAGLLKFLLLTLLFGVDKNCSSSGFYSI